MPRFFGRSGERQRLLEAREEESLVQVVVEVPSQVSPNLENLKEQFSQAVGQYPEQSSMRKLGDQLTRYHLKLIEDNEASRRFLQQLISILNGLLDSRDMIEALKRNADRSGRQVIEELTKNVRDIRILGCLAIVLLVVGGVLMGFGFPLAVSLPFLFGVVLPMLGMLIWSQRRSSLNANFFGGISFSGDANDKACLVGDLNYFLKEANKERENARRARLQDPREQDYATGAVIGLFQAKGVGPDVARVIASFLPNANDRVAAVSIVHTCPASYHYANNYANEAAAARRERKAMVAEDKFIMPVEEKNIEAERRSVRAPSM